jgi:hypothetical protein
MGRTNNWILNKKVKVTGPTGWTDEYSKIISDDVQDLFDKAMWDFTNEVTNITTRLKVEIED